MRIALLLTGHLRTFRKTHGSYLDLLHMLEKIGKVDVFCHTWDIEESVTASWWKEHQTEGPPPPNVRESEVIQHYNPKNWSIESSRQFDEIPVSIKSIIPISGILSMLYSQYQAFRLMQSHAQENGIKYDLVLKTRYDLGYEVDSVFQDLVKRHQDRSFLWVPNSNPYELSGAYADIFAAGSADKMETYLRFYEHFESQLKVYQQNGYLEVVPELCLRTYLDMENIKPDLLEGIRVHILRANGDIFRICSDRSFSRNEPLCFVDKTIDRNRIIFPAGSSIVDENLANLVLKYMNWVFEGDTSIAVQVYLDLFNGKWVGTAPLKALARKAGTQVVLADHVIRLFLEKALRRANYGFVSKLRFAWIMFVHSPFGHLYFRVLLKNPTNQPK